MGRRTLTQHRYSNHARALSGHNWQARRRGTANRVRTAQLDYMMNNKRVPNTAVKCMMFNGLTGAGLLLVGAHTSPALRIRHTFPMYGQLSPASSLGIEYRFHARIARSTTESTPDVPVELRMS